MKQIRKESLSGLLSGATLIEPKLKVRSAPLPPPGGDKVKAGAGNTPLKSAVSAPQEAGGLVWVTTW